MAKFIPRELSFVQLKILANFLRAPQLSYTQGRPEDVDNDLYKYHLNFLQEKEIIEKVADKYQLTEYGKYLTQTLDVFGNPKSYFKISVLPYVLNNEKILLQKRSRQPYFGDVETVSGKLHLGEDVCQAANRKLKEETGLTAEFKFVGVIRKIRKTPEGHLFEDTLYHVCFGQNPRGNLIANNDFGENFWATISEALELVKKNITYGKYTQEIIDRLSNNNFEPFYFVEELTLPRI